MHAWAHMSNRMGIHEIELLDMYPPHLFPPPAG